MGSNMLKLFCCVFFESFALLTKISGPQWCHNSPTLSSTSSNGVGYVVEVGGLKSYVSGSPNAKHAVILASDIYGYEVPNLRLIADKAAAAGFYAVVPDFLHGDPYDDQNPARPLPEWMKSHPPEKGVEDAKVIIAALRSQGISAIGVAGFCWGGKVAVELAKTDYIQAAVLLHPTLVTVDDIKEVEVPIAILGGENDTESPPSLLKQFEDILSSKPEIDSYVKIFPGVCHGWTTRYDLDDEKAVTAANEAHRDMIDWFIKYVN